MSGACRSAIASCVSGTPQCGNCYQCLRGRADMCQFLGRQGPNDLVPIADMRDGTPVYANSHIGGLAELMVTFEEWIVPVFTKASAVELGHGLQLRQRRRPRDGHRRRRWPRWLRARSPPSSAADRWASSAVQGASIAGASKIIAIDPDRARRELALKVGATDVLDPNVEGEKLVAKVREMSSTPNNRLWSGGRDSGGLLGGSGADFVIEGVGADRAKPRVEAGPDPTGVLPMRQAYEMCAPGGHVITTSLPTGNDFASRPYSSPSAGAPITPVRLAAPTRCADIPRFVAMLDAGQHDAKVARHARGADRAHARGLRRVSCTAPRSRPS